MYRCCASKGDDLGMLGDFREFFGSDERRLIRKLQAAEQQLKSEREASQQAAANAELCRDEVREYEASYRNAQQKLHDADRMASLERRNLRAEVESQAAELRAAEQNFNLEARRECAEVRCKAFTEGAQKGEKMMLDYYEDALARAVQCGREEGIAEGARKGEEVMLERYEDALLRAVQHGRQECSAEIHAVSEISQSLRDQLHVAEAAQRKTAQELAVEERVSSLRRSETAREIAELREELQCARQEHHSQITAVATKSDHVRDADVSRQVSTRSTELTTAVDTDCRSAEESNSSVCSMHEECDPEVDRVSAADSQGAVASVARDLEETIA